MTGLDSLDLPAAAGRLPPEWEKIGVQLARNIEE